MKQTKKFILNDEVCDEEDIDIEINKINRKIMGTIELVGYLFNMGLISPKIIYDCIIYLLRFEKDKQIEGCKVLFEIINLRKIDVKLRHHCLKQITAELEKRNNNSENKIKESGGLRIKFMLEDMKKMF